MISAEKHARVEERLIGFWCLNSSVVFKPIADEARSVILTSGTLSPMVSFASELATRFEHDLEADHVIKESQIWVGSISTGPKGSQLVGNYNNYNSVEYQEQLGLSILRILKIVPKGVLIFMPSYG